MDATKTVAAINSNGQSAVENVSASAHWYSDALNVDGYFEGIISWLFGRTTASAASAGANLIVEFSLESSGENDWREHNRYTTLFAACEAENVNGACAAGVAAIPMASTSNYTVGELFYIKNSTLDNSEWKKVITVTSNTNVGIDSVTANDQAGSACYDQAEEWNCYINVGSIKRIRCRMENFSQAADIKIKGIFQTAVE